MGGVNILGSEIQFTQQLMPTRPLGRRLLQAHFLDFLCLDPAYLDHRLCDPVREFLPGIPIRAREIDAPSPTRHGIQVIPIYHPASEQKI